MNLFHLRAVDDECKVVSDVALHVLDALAQLDVLVVPADRARRQRDDPAREPRGVALDGQRRDRLDHEPAIIFMGSYTTYLLM